MGGEGESVSEHRTGARPWTLSCSGPCGTGSAATARRRWAEYLAVVVLIGLLGGVAPPSSARASPSERPSRSGTTLEASVRRRRRRPRRPEDAGPLRPPAGRHRRLAVECHGRHRNGHRRSPGHRPGARPVERLRRGDPRRPGDEHPVVGRRSHRGRRRRVGERGCCSPGADCRAHPNGGAPASGMSTCRVPVFRRWRGGVVRSRAVSRTDVGPASCTAGSPKRSRSALIPVHR